jgi:hypothetical protein
MNAEGAPATSTAPIKSCASLAGPAGDTGKLKIESPSDDDPTYLLRH